MNKTNGSFVFGGKTFYFLRSKSKYNFYNFLLSDEYKEEIKELLNISDNLNISEENKLLYFPNSIILMIYEHTEIYGMFEVRFKTNIPIEEIREIKIKKLIND